MDTPTRASDAFDATVRHIDSATYDSLVNEGRAVLRFHTRLVEDAAEYAKRERIGGYDVPVVCCPCIALVSDLGHKLAQGEPFAATYAEKADGTRVYSLRSTPDGVDVGRIAKELGGGGHRHASGFRRSPSKLERAVRLARRILPHS